MRGLHGRGLSLGAVPLLRGRLQGRGLSLGAVPFHCQESPGAGPLARGGAVPQQDGVYGRGGAAAEAKAEEAVPAVASTSRVARAAFPYREAATSAAASPRGHRGVAEPVPATGTGESRGRHRACAAPGLQYPTLVARRQHRAPPKRRHRACAPPGLQYPTLVARRQHRAPPKGRHRACAPPGLQYPLLAASRQHHSHYCAPSPPRGVK